MTRTTLKALWFGGGGLLATWLAVSPHGTPPAVSPAQQVATAAAQRTSDNLNTQADLLRARTAVALRPTTRNPFRFSSPRSTAKPSPAREETLPAATVPETPAFPPMSLAGIAENAGKRTAVITSGTQMYLVSDGETVAGALTVVRIDADAVLLRNPSGAELQLLLQR